MPRRPSMLFAVALLFGGAVCPVVAELCTVDPVPGATLLLPHFRVNLRTLNKASAEDTQFWIHNADASSVVARVTLWTDLSVPTLAFNVELSGYEVQRVSVADIFKGEIPSDLETCPLTGLSSADDLEDAHSGRAVGAFGGQCAAQRLSGRVATGYVTVDSAQSGCSDLLPTDPGYFVRGGKGVASNRNVLWGDVQVGNRKYSQSEALIALEASKDARLNTAGQYTFYGRYVNWDASDNREPLGSVWAGRWAKTSSMKTSLVVWRDSGAVQEPFDCGDLGSVGWLPLEAARVAIFDEEQNVIELTGDDALPAETQEIEVGGSDLPVGGFLSGRIVVDLGHSGSAYQALVMARQGFRKRRGRTLLTQVGGSLCGGAPQ